MSRSTQPSAQRRCPGLAVILGVAGVLSLPQDARAQVTSQVRVEVREATTEHPVADAEVSVADAGRTAWTGGDGKVLMRGVPTGRSVFRVRRIGFAPTEVSVEVVNGVTSELLLHLEPLALEVEGVDVSVEGLPAGARTVSADEVGPEARTIEDLVERVPGVTVVRRGGPGTPSVPRIRGSSGNQVLVLVDGVAINSPLTGEADLSEVDFPSVARVVVVPGAQASRYGPRALAGAILIETRRGGSSRIEGSLATGTLGVWGLDGSATMAHPRGGWAFVAGGAWNRATGAFEYPVPDLRGGGRTTRQNAQVRNLSAFGQVVRDHVGGTRLRLKLHARDTRRGSPGTIVQPSLTGRQHQRRLGILAQVEAGDATRGWEATASLDDHRALFEDPTPPFGPTYRSDTRVRQIEARAEARRNFGDVALSAGGDGRYTGIDATTLAPDAPGGVGGAGTWIRTGWRVGDPDARYGLDLSGTVRADVHDLLDGIVLSPSVTLVLNHESTALEVTTGSSVSPPDVSDLFFQEGVLAEANPELAPERVRGEVSAEVRRSFVGDGWEGAFSLSGFVADVDGMILWFPDHRFVWRPENIDVRRRGLEATGRLRSGAFASLRGSLSLTDVTYDVAVLTGQVVYRPRLGADVGGDVNFAGVDWSASWRWVGARRTSPGTDLNELPGYGRADLGAAVPFTLTSLHGSLELGVDNILDQAAALLVDYPLPGRTFTVRVRAGAPVP